MTSVSPFLTRPLRSEEEASNALMADMRHSTQELWDIRDALELAHDEARLEYSQRERFYRNGGPELRQRLDRLKTLRERFEDTIRETLSQSARPPQWRKG